MQTIVIEAGVFAFNLGGQMKDVSMQRKGVNLIVDSGVAPAEMKPAYTFQQASLSVQ
jgi:hypothetical protein